MHHVVIGNGICGTEAVLALRRRDPSAQVTVVSSEHDHFFSRPALMYVLAGQLSLRDTEPRGRDLHREIGFDLRRGRVVEIDVDGRRLQLEDGRALEYDQLLLALGSRARPAPWPGSAGRGVHAFVTLQDLEALERDVPSARRAIVVGGGLIGIEVAETLLHRGLEVTYLAREETYLPVALDPREAEVVAEHMRSHGCNVRLGTAVEEVLRDARGTVRGVRAGGEQIAGDLVVTAIGVEPNTAFLRGSSSILLGPGGGIEVDDALRTTAPHVWAAGDCASVPRGDGTRRTEQLWYTARDQGRVAAAAMLGDPVVHRRGPLYNSAKFFDLEYTTAGEVPGAAGGSGVRSWFERVAGRPVTRRITHRDGRVVGFNTIGSRWDHRVLLRWIEEGRALDDVLARLHEAAFDEELS